MLKQDLGQLEKHLYTFSPPSLPVSIDDVNIVVQSGKEEDRAATRKALRDTYEVVKGYLRRYNLDYVLPREVRVSGELDGQPYTLYTSEGVYTLPFLPQALGAYSEYDKDDEDVLLLHRAYLEGGSDVKKYIDAYKKAAEICRKVAENPLEAYRARLEATELYRGYRRALASIEEGDTEAILAHELGHVILVSLGIFSPLDQMMREYKGDPTAEAHVITEEGLNSLFTEQILGRETVGENHPYYKPKKLVESVLLEKYGTTDVGKLIRYA